MDYTWHLTPPDRRPAGFLRRRAHVSGFDVLVINIARNAFTQP